MIQLGSTKQELHEYFVKLHKRIHWLLLYKEEDFPVLDDYFDYLIFQVNGLHKLMLEDYKIMELMVLLESAKLESNKENYNHRLYRKAILDAHSLVDDLDKAYGMGESVGESSSELRKEVSAHE